MGKGARKRQQREASSVKEVVFTTELLDPTAEKVDGLVATAAAVPTTKVVVTDATDEFHEFSPMASELFVNAASERFGPSLIGEEMTNIRKTMMFFLLIDVAATSVCIESNLPLIQNMFVDDGIPVKDKPFMKKINAAVYVYLEMNQFTFGLETLPYVILGYVTMTRWKPNNAFRFDLAFRDDGTAKTLFDMLFFVGHNLRVKNTEHKMVYFPRIILHLENKSAN